jgi:phosphate transport system substrate-binding protein
LESNESKGMVVIHRKSKGLFAVSVVAIAALFLGTAAASAAVTGAGSSLAGSVMPNWTNGFLIKEGITVSYSSIGVEAGLAKLDSRSVDFAAADAPLSAEQAAACNDCAEIPWLFTGVDVGFRLTGVKKLNLSGEVLAGIYSGKIKTWSDPKIAELNPKAKLPKLTIKPIYPSEASGETWAFTSYLSKTSPAWKKAHGGPATVVGFPVGSGASADRGVGAAIGSTNGSLGFVSATYAAAAGTRTAAIENVAGKFVTPDVESIEAAGKSVAQVPAGGIINATNPPKTAPDAYPIAMFSYAVVPHGAPQKAFVAQFLNYAVTTGQGLVSSFDFAPLPKAVKNAARSAIAAL